MAYSRQGRAITGRRQYNPVGISRTPSYYPKFEVPEEVIPERQYPYSKGYDAGVGSPNLDTGYYGGMNKDDMIAAQEEGYYENLEREKRGEPPLTEKEIHQAYVDKYKIPGDTLQRLRSERSANLPGGDMDISQGMAEGQTNIEGVPIFGGLQEGSTAQQKGDVKGAIKGYGKAAFETATLPAQIPAMIFGPPIKKGYEFLKGLSSSDDPTSGSAVGSGIGISGLSGPMGLANVEGQIAANPQGLSPGYGENQGFSSSEGPLGMDAGVGTQGPMGFAQAQDLADLDIGGFGFGGPGGMGGDLGPALGGSGGGLGIGGNDPGMGEW